MIQRGVVLQPVAGIGVEVGSRDGRAEPRREDRRQSKTAAQFNDVQAR